MYVRVDPLPSFMHIPNTAPLRAFMYAYTAPLTEKHPAVRLQIRIRARLVAKLGYDESSDRLN